MQSQAAMIAAAGITIERAAWYRLDELVAIANQLEPAKLDKQLEEIAGALMATMQRAGVTTAVFEQAMLMALLKMFLISVTLYILSISCLKKEHQLNVVKRQMLTMMVVLIFQI